MLDEKRIQFCNVSHILLFRYFEQERCQRLLKIFAPYVTVYGHTRTKMVLAATRFEKSKNEDRTLITKTHGLSDEIFFDFRFRCFQLPVFEKQPTSRILPWNRSTVVTLLGRPISGLLAQRFSMTSRIRCF